MVEYREITKELIEKAKEDTYKAEQLFNILGFRPSTIWDIDFSKNSKLPEFVKTQQQDSIDFEDSVTHLDKKNEVKNLSLSLGLKSVRKKDGTGGISIFPYDLCEKIIKFYTRKDENIFDPFSGHITRGFLCYLFNRNYYGYDISKKFYDENTKNINKYINNTLIKKDVKIKYYNKDSRYIHFNNNCFDFIFSSPPYYDLEYYGDEPEQLGKCETYTDFLIEMMKIYKECFRILKNNSYIAININDFRKNGIFYNYHNDTISCLEQSGFKLHDIIIINWGSSFRSCFMNQMYETKIVGKQHEYLIVCKKVTNNNSINEINEVF